MSCASCAQRRAKIAKTIGEAMAKAKEQIDEKLKKRAARRKQDALIDELQLQIKTKQAQLREAKNKRKAGVA